MDSFTPIPATVGGLLIGLSAAILWLGNGRIAGISGIFGQLLPPATDRGLACSLSSSRWSSARLRPRPCCQIAGGKPTTLVEAPHWFAGGTPVWIVLSGLLTGFGTKIGNGCTSGHGVCGLARLSTRSIVAVGVFFVVAILTVTVTGIV